MSRIGTLAAILLLGAPVLAAPTSYTHSIATDFGGSFYASNWQAEINASSIVTQIDHAAGGITVSGDTVTTWFKDALSAGDETTLNGLPASHDATPSAPIGKVQIEPQVGVRSTYFDGIAITAEASSEVVGYFAVPESLMVNGAQTNWEGMKLGDRAIAAVINPATGGLLGASASSGQADVTVATGEGVYYVPGTFLEIQDGSGNLLECRTVASVSGDVVTLASNLSATYDTTHKAYSRLSAYSPLRGTDGIDGGQQLLGSSGFLMWNQNEMSAPIPAGMHMCVRLWTTADAGTRNLVFNVIMRKP